MPSAVSKPADQIAASIGQVPLFLKALSAALPV
jgi:hypothetical protein